MKNYKILPLCFVFLMFDCRPKIKKGPIVSYNTKMVNLGNLQFEKSFSGKIVVRNEGDEALKIDNILPDCSCTVPEPLTTAIEPGDSATLKFVLTPRQSGFIQQSLYVQNNSRNESTILFLIRANVILEEN
jgi:hypothetical protein